MIIGTAITLGGLAYTVLYSGYNYSGIERLDHSFLYLAALALYNGCAIAALATQHPCYQFIDVGVCAFLVNVLFVFYPAKENQLKTYAATLKATLFLAFLALFANIANCADGCCK